MVQSCKKFENRNLPVYNSFQRIYRENKNEFFGIRFKTDSKCGSICVNGPHNKIPCRSRMSALIIKTTWAIIWCLCSLQKNHKGLGSDNHGLHQAYSLLKVPWQERVQMLVAPLLKLTNTILYVKSQKTRKTKSPPLLTFGGQGDRQHPRWGKLKVILHFFLFFLFLILNRAMINC